jgi:FkbM family methyltransferase
MEKAIRSILIRVLGFETYLRLVSRIYLRMVLAGLLKKKYPELFYLKQLIKPGFVCIDVGANVGYYTVFMSRFAGKNGHVYAVEPVELFTRIFRANTQAFGLNNITLHHTALGGSAGEVVMGTPVINGVLRHGLTHVLTEGEDRTGMQCYEVPMQVPDILFATLSKIDFIKCDVEGYEVYLFPHLMNTLRKHKPVLQIEISGSRNIETMLNILEPIGYKPHGLQNGSLILLQKQEALQWQHDFYFIAQN